MGKKNRMMINKIWKKYWGAIPVIVFMSVKLLVILIGGFTDSVLRIIPQMILSCFGVISIYILVFWLGRIFLWRKREHPSAGIKIVRKVLSVIYCIMVVGTMGIGIIFSAFSYHPEHVVEKNGIRMVASVNSFLQEMVYYYEYKNAVFRGSEQIGWEDYGNGGGDPFQQEQEPVRWFFEELDGNTVESGGK